jgi:selenocysteine-specific elongation factor
MKSVIVGTAGHIDHGKSSLVQALTGTHPDRLAEEKRRGITIDLGFAFLEEGGTRFGFVDVPGHERFVSNMLAGAAGIDIVLLVIAADESIKPQTKEHFDICRLLGVKHGVVVLTKSDLVDRETLDFVRLEVEEFLKGSFLCEAPIIAVSVRSRSGLDELKMHLQAASASDSRSSAEDYFRLPIDRAFAMKGFGSVVTGTLISGTVGPGDEVELFPSGERLRVRGVHSGGKAVERAQPGQRTAVNLAGIDHTALSRGMVLTTPGKFRKTRRLDVRLELLPFAKKLKQRESVHFHSGTTQTIAEVHSYALSDSAATEPALAHLKLKDEVLVLPSDRFIIRQFSPVVTIGGGIILDPLARRPARCDAGRPSFLHVLVGGEKDEVLAAMTERSLLGLNLDEIIARTAWSATAIAASVKSLTSANKVRQVSSEPLILIAPRTFEEIRKKLMERVERFHLANPLLPGIAREDLRTNLGRRVRPETFRAALEELVAQKKLEIAGELVRKAGAQILMQPEEAKTKDQIELAFASAGLSVPSVKEVLTKLPIESHRAEKLLQMLLRDRILVRVSPALVFHRKALDALKALLLTHKKSRGDRITIPVFKDLTGITRKYAIPLLEYLDRERVTRRAGDERVIL